jgi:hypothetical protein
MLGDKASAKQNDMIQAARKQVLQVRYMLKQLVNHGKTVHDLRKMTRLSIPEISSRIVTFGLQALKLLEANGAPKREIVKAMAANQEMTTAFNQKENLEILVERLGRALHRMSQGIYIIDVAHEAGLAPENLNHHIAVFNLGLIAYLDYHGVKETVVCDAMVKCLCGLDPQEAIKQAEEEARRGSIIWTRMWHDTRLFLS